MSAQVLTANDQQCNTGKLVQITCRIGIKYLHIQWIIKLISKVIPGAKIKYEGLADARADLIAFILFTN